MSTVTVTIPEHVIRRLPDDATGRYLRAKLADLTGHRSRRHRWAGALANETFRVQWDAEVHRLNDHAQTLYAARLDRMIPTRARAYDTKPAPSGTISGRNLPTAGAGEVNKNGPNRNVASASGQGLATETEEPR